MKKIVLPIVLIAVVGFLWHLATDDPLDTEARLWIQYFSKTPNLNQNAYLSLIALGKQGSTPYEDATAEYLASVSMIQKGLLDYDKQLKYPKIDRLPNYDNEEIYCSLEEKGCFNQLLENKDVITLQMAQFDSILSRFLDISTLSNFDFLDSIATEPDLSVLTNLFRFMGIKILFLIDDGEHRKAASMLASLVKLDRTFSLTSSEAVFIVLPIVHYETIYMPLVELLVKSGFKDWDLIKPVLKPLSVDEISMNKMWLRLFADGTRALKVEYLADEPSKNDGLLHEFLARVKYKENMTINTLFGMTKNQLIPESTNKSNLFSEYLLADERDQQANEERKKELENITWSSIKNYRNVVGHLLTLTANARLLNLYEDMVITDLRILLLNVLIQSGERPLNEIIKDPALANPYTNEPPTLEGSNICYMLKETTCISVMH